MKDIFLDLLIGRKKKFKCSAAADWRTQEESSITRCSNLLSLSVFSVHVYIPVWNQHMYITHFNSFFTYPPPLLPPSLGPLLLAKGLIFLFIFLFIYFGFLM